MDSTRRISCITLLFDTAADAAARVCQSTKGAAERAVCHSLNSWQISMSCSAL